MASLKAFSTLLVNDVEGVIQFMELAIPSMRVTPVKDEFPFSGVIAKIARGGMFLVIDKATCDEKVLGVLSTLNYTMHVSITADDAELVKQQLVILIK